MTHIYKTNDDEFYNDMEGVEFVLVEFFKDNCPPCDSLLLELEELSDTDAFGIMKINYEESETIVIEAKVRTPPTLVLYKNGKKFRSIYGKGLTAKKIEVWFNDVTNKDK